MQLAIQGQLLGTQQLTPGRTHCTDETRKVETVTRPLLIYEGL
jgi:hypothetical protein